MKKYILLFIAFLIVIVSNAQTKKLVQFSGVIVDADSLTPIPFSSVIIQNTRRGTSSDFFGFYSFVAQAGDSIVFSNLGYKTALFVIPDTLSNNRYSIIQVLKKDTILLDEVTIYPWPSKEEFRQAFLNLKIPSDDYQRAMYNLDQSRMQEKFEGLEMDDLSNYKFAMNQHQTKLYNSGLNPTISLLNPVAWMRFIEEWKKGTYKK